MKTVYVSVDGRGEITPSGLSEFTSLSSALSGLEGIRAEDFERIVRANQQRVFRVLYSLVRDRDTADTLTQECFLRAYRKRHSFRGEANVSTWLVRIAINLARDYGRNQRLAFWRKLFAVSREDRHGPAAAHIPDPTPSPERVLLAREQLQSVWTAVEQLPQQQRTAFALRFVAEMSLGEIADVMDLEVGTVKAHLFRAVSAIRKGVRGEKES